MVELLAWVCREKTHEPASETISGPGRVDDGLKRRVQPDVLPHLVRRLHSEGQPGDHAERTEGQDASGESRILA